MTWPLRHLSWSQIGSKFLACAAIAFAGAVQAAAVIAQGTPTSSVPAALDDPSATLSDPLPSGRFLLPIQISDASGLQDWSFDLTFDDTVVQPVDAGGMTQQVYAAEFSDADPTLSGITSSGLLVTDALVGIAGFSSGVSGDGLLAFVLFEFLEGQDEQDPNFGIENPSIGQSVPEPGTMLLLATALLTLGWARRSRAAASGCQTTASLARR
jgi:hypothetical protein